MKELDALAKRLKEALLNGEFELIEACCNRKVLNIKIDGVRFQLWIPENPTLHFNFFFNDTPFKYIEIFESDNERKQAYNKVKQFIDKEKLSEAMSRKEELEAELAEINKNLSNK